MPVLLSPPFALLAYIGLTCLLLGVARVLTVRRGSRSRAAEALYASGEAPARTHAAPGYQPFFASALFFALLHVGVLIASIATLQPIAIAYAMGVLVVLLIVALS